MNPHDPLERLRRANPRTVSPVTEENHELLLRDILATPRASPRRRWSSTTVLATVVALIAGTGVAFAATGTRLPLLSSPKIVHSPNGAVVRSSIGLLTLRVPDADGRAPWGVRVYTTSRGFKCVETGRVVNEKLGSFTVDGSFVEKAAGQGPCTGPAPSRPPSSGYGLTAEMVLTANGTLTTSPDSPCAPADYREALHHSERRLQRLNRRTATSARRASLSAQLATIRRLLAIATPKPECQARQLRHIAYGVPAGISSAYLVVLNGTASTKTLHTRTPCERVRGRLVAAVEGRCPR